jgi:hypothetical protein
MFIAWIHCRAPETEDVDGGERMKVWEARCRKLRGSMTPRIGRVSYRGVEGFKWKDLPFIRGALQGLAGIIFLEDEKAGSEDGTSCMHPLLAFGLVVYNLDVKITRSSSNSQKDGANNMSNRMGISRLTLRLLSKLEICKAEGGLVRCPSAPYPASFYLIMRRLTHMPVRCSHA